MLIDWFTVTAQVVNFAILVWLLKRFLYGPILRAMEQREQRIAQQLRDADSLRAEAAAEASEMSQMRRALDGRRAELLTQVHEDAEAERTKLINQARAEIETLRQRWIGALEHDKRSLLKSIATVTGAEAVAIARKTIRNLSGQDLEQRVVQIFLRRLRDTLAKAPALRTALSQVDVVEVSSAFLLDDETRQSISSTLAEVLGGARRIEFRVDETMTLGMRLVAAERDITLSIDDYLDEVQRSLENLLNEELWTKHEPVAR